MGLAFKLIHTRNFCILDPPTDPPTPQPLVNWLEILQYKDQENNESPHVAENFEDDI